MLHATLTFLQFQGDDHPGSILLKPCMTRLIQKDKLKTSLVIYLYLKNLSAFAKLHVDV